VIGGGVVVDVGVLAVVSEAVSLRASMRAVEVEVLSGETCALVAEEMARLEKASAALRAMAAARAADCGAHRSAGFDDADVWLAQMTGETRHTARSELATGSRLADCPRTRAAAADGELSLGQAEDITKVEREKPGSEDALVPKAKSSSRQQLAEDCRKRRHEGVDRKALAARQRARRSFRAWIDGEGMQCGLFKFEPVMGVALLARVQVEADRRHREARRQRSSDPWEAHAADALAAILAAGFGWSPPMPATDADAAADAAPDAAESEPDEASTQAPDGGSTPAAKPRARRRADVVFVVDLRTFRGGEHPDSICHLIGGGPVPPRVVREMARDSFLKVVFHDGVNIHTVTHLGRYIPAELRTALEIGNPPDFDGVACSVCGNKFRLQWDHVDPVCAGGLTSFANEDSKCWGCHTEKSRQEREAGLYRRRRQANDPEPDDTG